MKRGDGDTDALYATLRGRFGDTNPRANGYRYTRYFEREQTIVLSLVNPEGKIILDACCGSGLMLQPLLGVASQVLGIDFNADACRAARSNNIPVTQGDVYQMPFADGSVDEIVNCQFFNQQDATGVLAFIAEAARILRHRGRLILVWRNANAIIHRLSHACLRIVDHLRGFPDFPQLTHSFPEVIHALGGAGFTVEHAELSCPPLGWRSRNIHGLLGTVIGASCILVAYKNDE